jgi:hypothetical protein
VVAAIGRDKVLELYYQDPKFGFFLIRLVASRLLSDAARPPAEVAH